MNCKKGGFGQMLLSQATSVLLITDLSFYPGIVSCRTNGHLDNSGTDEQHQDSRGHKLPHVEVEGIWPEPKHVLQVLHKPVTR